MIQYSSPKVNCSGASFLLDPCLELIHESLLVTSIAVCTIGFQCIDLICIEVLIILYRNSVVNHLVLISFWCDIVQLKGTMYDLLEQGVYSTEVFLERSASLQSRISEAQSNVAQLKLELDKERQREANIEQFLPACEDLLSCYWDLSIPERNRLLKFLIESIEYKKLTKNKRGHLNEPNFELTIKPRIPRK